MPTFRDRLFRLHVWFLLFGLCSEPVVLKDWLRPPAGRRLVQSSFRIVPVATASATDAPTALRSSTVKVSSGSRVRSDLTVIVIFWLQTPGWKIRVPLGA